MSRFQLLFFKAKHFIEKYLYFAQHFLKYTNKTLNETVFSKEDNKKRRS